MITKTNFKSLLKKLDFTQNGDIFIKKFEEFDCELRVDFKNQKLIYPENKGLIVNDKTTSNFSSHENFVVYEAVHRLLTQGYKPNHIELEKKWQLGHTQKSGKADIVIKDNADKIILIIECKIAGNEYKKAINILENDSRNQLFSYLQQAPTTKFLALYSSDFCDGKVEYDYYLVNVTDNKELLQNNPKLKSYKEAKTVEEKYRVWIETYGKEYATIGLFEDNRAYEIGKNRFSIKDLKSVSIKDIQGKYHQFATILRQHNISGRENAFDKLINLFLCKVTDEMENPNDLKFYYKGMAYDDPFSFQDRLQQLYKIGMEKFLEDKITYIENKKIDEAFGVFKDKPNVTKELIKNYFKELKFFTNSDFAFIDVHNEKLFYQNFEVLLKVVKIFQDMRLTGSEENQFLGDMFEGFLDQGVKQSEGQFFTPLPIVKFIINSLPDLEKPNVIDYACGAGHFLNEYANLNKDSYIVGVEKEYRLSKVAKVSSFMYGHNIEIVYADALSSHNKIKEKSFDCLVSNPPYSVKGFLTTLSKKDRENYELIDDVDVKSYSKTGAIECFFLERVCQLLKENGISGIIVPSSILNKDTPKLYTTTREIILKYFDIVAIVEFGSGTFGKTGTNTVTLFLKKREEEYLFEHYENMINEWFNGDFKINEIFRDEDKLKEYCKYQQIDFSAYKQLLCNELNSELFKNETFSEYKKAFEKSSLLKELKKKRYFKELGKIEQEERIEKELIAFIKTIEKDKLLYFMLASFQRNAVVIVKSPTSNSEIKKFLGYEWSGRKGDEGIKYITKESIRVDENLDEDDKRVLENLQGIKYIDTPLYNPQNLDDNLKINKIIKDNFEYGKFNIPDSLKKYVSSAKLVDMLDFSRVEFNKAINLNPTKKVETESKWELVRLGDVADILIVGTPSRNKPEYFNGNHLWVSIAEINNQIITNTKEKLSDDGVKNSNVKLIPKNTTLLSFKLSIGKTAIAGKDLYTNEAIAGLVIKQEIKEKLTDKYLFYLFSSGIINLDKNNFNAFGKSLNSKFLKNEVKIPLPPLNIQEKIAKECEEIDKISESLRIENVELKEKIERSFNEIYNIATETVRLSDEESFEVFIGKRVLSKDIGQNQNDGIPVYSANVFEPFGYTKKEFLKDFSKPSVLWGIDGDWMVNILPKDTPFYPTDHCGVIRVKSDEIEPIYLKFVLYKEGLEQRFSRSNRASTARIKSLTIKIPSKDIQYSFSKKVNEFEIKINQNQKIIESSKAKKEEVLKKWL